MQSPQFMEASPVRSAEDLESSRLRDRPLNALGSMEAAKPRFLRFGESMLEGTAAARPEPSLINCVAVNNCSDPEVAERAPSLVETPKVSLDCG